MHPLPTDLLASAPVPATGPAPRIDAIVGVGLNVADVDRAAAFYTALGFTAVGPGRLTFGAAVLELTVATGAAYPEPHAAGDPWFQHFAIAVDDMAAAARAVLAAGATPVSVGGPQRLPANTGGVTAFKFRDPDGHPLELSHIPDSAWLRDAAPGAVFLGVDHTAIAVADLAVAQGWYEARGLRVIGRSRNIGPEQDRLDGLTGVVVDIVALGRGAGLHLELLGYRTPPSAAARSIGDGDIAATQTLIAGDAIGPDPDGHRLALTTGSP